MAVQLQREVSLSFEHIPIFLGNSESSLLLTSANEHNDQPAPAARGAPGD